MKDSVIVIVTKDGKIPLNMVRLLGNAKINTILGEEPFLDIARNFALYRAMKYDTILMVDDDVLPKLPITEIINNEYIRGYDVVCGIYWLKSFNSTSIAVENTVFGEITWLPYVPNRPTEVSVCGTGFLLINGDFLRKTYGKAKELGGWFDVKIVDWAKHKFIGEDVYFFKTFKPKAIADPRLVAWHKAYGIYYFNENGILETPMGVSLDE